MAEQKPEISFVIPVLNEQENVEELCMRIDRVMKEIKLHYEAIFVDDYSTDDTIERLEAIHESNPHIKAIQLSRRFGYQMSLFAGLEHVRGEIIITMDSDLQHPPEYVPQMVDKYREGYDVVNMVRQKASDKSPTLRVGSTMFYRLINSLSPTPVTTDSADFRLFSRRAIDALKQFPEKTIFLRGLVGWIGYRQSELPYDEGRRRYGKSKFNLWKSIRFAADAIVSFSTSPLYAAVYLGAIISMIGLVYGIYICINALLSQVYPAGWPTLVCMILLMGGLQMILIGIIGIYIAKIFLEAKGRPRYIINRKIGFVEH
jgi:glycosyltransferase involved in cell wall biosynthesis